MSLRGKRLTSNISFHRCFLSLLIISALSFYGVLASGETDSTKSPKTLAGNQKKNPAENAKGKTSIPNFKQGEFTLHTKIPGNKEVKVSYIVPVDDKGKPRLSAHNIVFYAPYIGERGFFKRDFLKYFPEELGFTIFSLNINKLP